MTDKMKKFLKLFVLFSLSSYGALWGILEGFAFSYGDSLPQTIKEFWIWVVLLSIILGLIIAKYQSQPKKKSYYNFANTDIKIGYQVGNIFKTDGAKVIPFNTNLQVETEDEGGSISPNSLQGQLLKSFYDSPNHMKNDIQNNFTESIEDADLGTVLSITPRNSKFYLVALTSLNCSGVASSCRFEDIQACLNNLWIYIETHSSTEKINIPLLGTGKGKLNISRTELSKEIVRSIAASISESKICDQFTICIYPDDIKNFDINLEELDEYIRLICKYTVFSTSNSPIGSSL